MAEEKVFDREKVRGIVQHLKAQGKKIVFTNGCFDLIHVGHVRCLKQAKRLGDILVVALNTDASVSRLKPGRPVTPEEQRAEVVAALEMVDLVTFFSEDTPYDLIRSLMPDVLVKGGDWEKSEIIGSDLVPETYSLPYLEGISTTAVLERVKKANTSDSQKN